MNKKSIKILGVTFIMSFSVFFINIDNVLAKCSEYQGNSTECKNATEDGYACKYNASKKGGARCYKSDVKADTSDSDNSSSDNSSNTTSENTNQPCNQWASKGKEVCVTKSYNGYKCSWDINRKGGARCYQSDNPTDDKKETIEDCSNISNQNVCVNSMVKGQECIWRQGACYGSFDNGTDETIIASNKLDRKKTENREHNDITNILTWGKTANKDGYSGYNPEDVGNPCRALDPIKEDLSKILWVIDIVGILLLIIMTSINFIKAITGSDEENLKKAFKNLIIRAVVVVILLLLPVIVGGIINIINQYAGNGTVKIGENGKPFCDIDK